MESSGCCLTCGRSQRAHAVQTDHTSEPIRRPLPAPAPRTTAQQADQRPGNQPYPRSHARRRRSPAPPRPHTVSPRRGSSAAQMYAKGTPATGLHQPDHPSQPRAPLPLPIISCSLDGDIPTDPTTELPVLPRSYRQPGNGALLPLLRSLGTIKTSKCYDFVAAMPIQILQLGRLVGHRGAGLWLFSPEAQHSF